MADRTFTELELGLAQMLHDQLNQLLFTAKFDIDILRGQVRDKRSSRMVQDVDDLLDPSIEALPSLAVEADPPVRYDTGLATVNERETSPPFPGTPVVCTGSAAPVGGPSGHPGGAIRILLADDHAIVRDSLARLLQMQPGIEVIGQASDGLMVVELARQLQPDVILMDVAMPTFDGVEATRRVVAESPCIRVIGFSMHRKSDMAAAMHKAGAVAYVSKTEDPDYLIAAIRNCAARQVGQV